MADSTLNRFLSRGTTAQKNAYTPSPPTPASGPTPGYFWFDTDLSAFYSWNGAAWVAATGDIQAQLDTISTTQGTILYYNGTNWVALAVGTSGQFLQTQGAGANPQWASASVFSSSIYLQYREQQAQNTAGGTFTTGAWRTRTLNTEVADAGGLGTLASNQITLTAGTYIIRASAPCWAVQRHQARLQNTTDASTVLVGPSGYAFSNGAGDGAVAEATVQGIFTIGASKALELQHQCQTTVATRGFGVEANLTTEVYSVVELWKVG